MRIAVIGAGISGLGAAFLLSRAHEVDVFEREPRLGGHAHTHAIELDGRTYRLDTGFLVFNARTYPLFTRLLGHLDVKTQWSDMSFSVCCRRCGLEFGSRHAGALFAQRRRLVDLRHWRLITGVLAYFRASRRFLEEDTDHETTLGEFLERARVGEDVRRHFVLPMASAIWSASSSDVRAFPARAILTFLDNHGLLTPRGAPRWRTVTGGSQQYVRALADRIPWGRIRASAPVVSVRRGAAGVVVSLASGETHSYGKVVLATHADDTLRLLEDASDEERDLLGRFRYSRNEAVLHTDDRVLPSRRAAWASWNCELADCRDGHAPATLTYHLNRLQSVPGSTQFCVSLNRARPVDGRVLARMSYAHPVLDGAALAAQARLAALNGTRNTYYAGAYLRHGFHEDGLVSAVDVARRLGVPW